MPYKPLTPQEIEEIASPVFKRYNVKRAMVFGSCARGEMHRGSDIDIVVSFDNLKCGFDFFEMKRMLESKLGRKVDLITEKGIENSAIREIVAAEARIVYEQRNSDTSAHA